MARSGRLQFAEGREKGGRREEEGRQEQGREREEEGGREERGTFLWSLGSRGVPWELSSGAWVLLGGPRGFQGCSSGTPGGCLGVLGLSPRGSWDVFWGLVVPVEPKRTILRTSSWSSWQPCLLSKWQQATKQETVEHVCQETKTDDSGDLFLGLLASMFAVERATGDRAENRRRCLPGDRNGRFWGPPFRPPGNHVHCRKKERPRRTPAGRPTGPIVHLGTLMSNLSENPCCFLMILRGPRRTPAGPLRVR